jgi:hypothetical protein
MKLSDLLSELRDNKLNDRHESTGDDDRLWSDTTLVRYINEAQRRFARRSFVLRDATTPEVVNLTLVEGQSQYDLHPSILSVISAKVDGQQADLTRLGHSALGSYQNPCTMIWDTSSWPTWSPGSPLAYTTDEQLTYDDNGSLATVSLRIFPEPDADADGTLIKLRVVRMPLDELTTNNLSAVPEIPEDHHLEMLCWAAHLAFSIADEDAGNQVLADKNAAMFEQYVQDARKLVLRKLFAPTGWGFGKSGWSWGS